MWNKVTFCWIDPLQHMAVPCNVCNKSNRIKCFIITNVIKMNSTQTLTNWLVLLAFSQFKYTVSIEVLKVCHVRSRDEWQWDSEGNGMNSIEFFFFQFLCPMNQPCAIVNILGPPNRNFENRNLKTGNLYW